MLFTLIVMVLLTFVSLTIVREYRRTRSLTLLSILSVGNVLYSAATPALFYYSPDSAVIFELYVLDSGMEIQDSGLIRILLAATIFQLVCLCVSFSGRQKWGLIRSDTINSRALLKAAMRVGWIMVLIGAVGVIWLGLIYNGHLWGLYEIPYLDRAALSRENPLQSFMLLLGIYGAAQLIVALLLSDRAKVAVLILLAMTLHGVGMKSKFPVFWTLLVFMGVAIGRGKGSPRLFLPIGFSALVLATMSTLRSVENLSELPEHIVTYWDLLGTTVATPWDNDLPGPASMLYYIINSEVVYTVEPILEAVKLLIPKFIIDRGPVLADVYTEKMLGSQYEPGLGFGWPPICDGFLLGGWLGVGLIAFVFARLARYIDDRRTKGEGKLREFFMIVCYSSVPSFLYGLRESTGGLLKQMLIVTVLVWLPTLYLSQKRKLQALKFSDNLQIESVLHLDASNPRGSTRRPPT